MKLYYDLRLKNELVARGKDKGPIAVLDLMYLDQVLFFFPPRIFRRGDIRRSFTTLDTRLWTTWCGSRTWTAPSEFSTLVRVSVDLRATWHGNTASRYERQVFLRCSIAIEIDGKKKKQKQKRVSRGQVEAVEIEERRHAMAVELTERTGLSNQVHHSNCDILAFSSDGASS
jgi:hypothetical protein